MVNVFSNHKNIFISLAFFSFGAYAENGTVWDLDNLQKQRVLYEAKAAVNKAKAEAEGKSYGGGAATGIIPNNNVQLGTPTITSGQNNANLSDVLPQLVKINGRNAVITMPDGNTTTVNAGQLLPGGRWQVVSVSINGVKVRNITSRKEEVLN
ncbi:type IV pilus biogenesis protein PilP [Salmonella enterica]|nr:type IV pilus biogenesis protein PilP [Salmonella enterica]